MKSSIWRNKQSVEKIESIGIWLPIRLDKLESSAL